MLRCTCRQQVDSTGHMAGGFWARQADPLHRLLAVGRQMWLGQTISAHPGRGSDLCWNCYWKHQMQNAALCPNGLLPSYFQSRVLNLPPWTTSSSGNCTCQNPLPCSLRAGHHHSLAGGRRDAVASQECTADAQHQPWQAKGRCWVLHCQVLHGGCAWSSSPLT